jgi:DNA helicase-2/ATP-dependent DNA helicase PcrA
MQLDGLNEQQRAAITAGEGPVLVLAGPGSGKTRVLTHRIGYLIGAMGVPARSIMAVTFTNKAAGEMRERVERLMGGRLHGLQIGTFHAICARLLRREHAHTPYSADYVIFDTEDQLTAVTQALNELGIDPKKFPPRQMLNAISGAKNELITPREYPRRDYREEIVARAFERYQTLLLDNNAMDFDDLLTEMVYMLREHDDVREKYQHLFDFILVDEFQDTNTAQYKLVQLLAAPRNNVFVVGDEDQGIYAFRGADYRNVMQFRRDYPQAQVFLLEQNYRSTQNILDAARAVIDRNPNRTPKALFTDRGEGSQITLTEAYNDEFEARTAIEKIEDLRREHGYGYGDVAVMYRTNAQSRALEDACVREGIPYKLIGGVGFYKRQEVRDLLAYLRLIHNPNDKVAFARVINTPKRGIGKQSLTDFQQWAADENLTYDAALKRLQSGGETRLSSRAGRLFADFGELLDRWRAFAAQADHMALLERVITDIGYNLYLREISDSDDQVTERRENIDQLRTLMAAGSEQGVPLGDLLADLTLMSEADSINEGENTVKLLTLHAAKGLEFPVVLICGVEEGLIPHLRSIENPAEMEEERRLFYVGITRAKDHLFLSYAFRRMIYGSSSASEPSRFLADIPVGILTGVSTRLIGRTGEEMYKRATSWSFGQSSRPARPPQNQHTPNDAVRSKITPFPGAQNRTPPQFPVNQRVFHSKFGAGMVIETRGSGDAEEVTVAFEDRSVGIKKFLAAFGNLEKVRG